MDGTHSTHGTMKDAYGPNLKPQLQKVNVRVHLED